MLINYPDNKTQKCRDYIQALEEERRKIQVFRRELPLCLDLVTQAIESYKQQLSETTTEYNLNGQSECSEQTTSAAPVLEQFIPMKSAQEDDDEDYEEQSHKSDNDDDDCVNKNNDNNNSEKSDWLRSVQLWNQFPDPTPKEESPEEVKRNGSGGAFQPFKKEKSGAAAAAQPPTAASSTAETGRSKKEDKESQRKQRRCWSPELHKRFLQALQQLGGSHAATPKQIREMMKVDGLTNDEVKSHLQKYRLHTRRPSPSNRNNSIQQQAAPQFVVVGGIWVPPAEYAAMAAAPAESKEATTSNGIYAPVASLPPSSPFQGPSALNRRSCGSDERGSQSNDVGVHSNSPATSSSTHTTTASPPY